MGFMTKPAFATDFSEYPLGAQLKDFGWTEQGVTGDTTDGSYTITAYSDSISGRGVLVSQGGAGQWRALTWDQLGLSVADVEILALMRLDALPNASGGGGVGRITQGGSGYAGCLFGTGSPHSAKVIQEDAGVSAGAVPGATQDVTLNSTGKFWLRFRAEGSNLSIKCWADGGAEPAFAAGVSSSYVHGRVGIQTVQKKNFRVYWFAVALNRGDRAVPERLNRLRLTHDAALPAGLWPFATSSCSLQESEQLRRLLDAHGNTDARGGSLIRNQKLHGDRHNIGIVRIKNRHAINDGKLVRPRTGDDQHSLVSH
jgi:hypothetical protein